MSRMLLSAARYRPYPNQSKVQNSSPHRQFLSRAPVAFQTRCLTVRSVARQMPDRAGDVATDTASSSKHEFDFMWYNRLVETRPLARSGGEGGRHREPASELR